MCLHPKEQHQLLWGEGGMPKPHTPLTLAGCWGRES